MAESSKKIKVIVVGGGLAGLSASLKLSQNAAQFSVTLLEADGTVGGRVKTLKLPDGTDVPLGATYFHGTKGNSLYDYALKNGFIRKGDIFKDSEKEVLYVMSDGTQLPSEVTYKIEKKMEALLENTTDIAQYDSVRNYLIDHLLPYITKQFKHLSLPTCDPAYVLEGFLGTEGITEGSKYLRNIDAKVYAEVPWSEGDRCAYFINNPFQSIVNSLQSSLLATNNALIHTHKEVHAIEWNKEKIKNGENIRVSCTDGTSFTADHVIVTLSLGVLNEISSHLFQPPLPGNRIEAIQRSGYCLVNKIILQFADYLFDPYYLMLQLHWTKEDEGSHLIREHPWIRGFNSIEYLPMSKSSSKIYLLWMIDEDAATIETVHKDVIKNVVCSVLRRCLKKALPDLLSVNTTSWSSKYTRGSYSFDSVGYNASLRGVLGMPIDGGSGLEIMFAGEATSVDFHSCAQAGFDTGLREAERLIKYYQKS